MGGAWGSRAVGRRWGGMASRSKNASTGSIARTSPRWLQPNRWRAGRRGGGLGVAYREGDQPPEIRAFMGCVRTKVEGKGLTVMVEPGRSIVGPAGVLVTRVLYRKRNVGKEFVVVDAAMNDLIRPSLYRS